MGMALLRHCTTFLAPRPALLWATPLLNVAAARGVQSAAGWAALSLASVPPPLPPDLPLRDDALAAIDAVSRACAATAAVQPLRGPPIGADASGGAERGASVVTKADLSPVTVGDFASQAVVLSRLARSYPADAFVAEEGSDALRSEPDLTARVMAAVSVALGGDDVIASDEEELWRSIDLGRIYDTTDGSYISAETGRGRVWCLDPIDGTKGFLRGRLDGGQYCVALALIEGGIPTIGVLGCPNLPAAADDNEFAWNENESEQNNEGTRGCIFVATKGGGCYQLDMEGKMCQRIRVTPNDGSVLDIGSARFCVGVEKGIADALGQANAIAEILHGPGAIDEDGDIVRSRRMDSQVKYGILARGGAEVYLRMPKPGYREWAWDHAAGTVVLTEAGGEITDVDGNGLDFSLGAKLPGTVRGIVGSNGGPFHSALLDAYRQQDEARKMA